MWSTVLLLLKGSSDAKFTFIWCLPTVNVSLQCVNTTRLLIII